MGSVALSMLFYCSWVVDQTEVGTVGQTVAGSGVVPSVGLVVVNCDPPVVNQGDVVSAVSVVLSRPGLPIKLPSTGPLKICRKTFPLWPLSLPLPLASPFSTSFPIYRR